MSVLCLGEVWLELNAATAPELTETFRAQTGGWGVGFCRQYAALGGQAALPVSYTHLTLPTKLEV